MQVNVTFKQSTSKDEVRSRAEEKATKLKKFMQSPVQINFVFYQDKLEHVAELTVAGEGALFVASDKADDYFSAIDTCIDKMIIQLKKHKEKMKNRKGSTKAGKQFLDVNMEDE